jgi:hypothetical protein
MLHELKVLIQIHSPAAPNGLKHARKQGEYELGAHLISLNGSSVAQHQQACTSSSSSSQWVPARVLCGLASVLLVHSTPNP